jgi:biopolymer transport protein ExbD
MQARPADRVKSDINVTPLVDVCLVLLIIFMVVTPLIGPGGDVDLPEASRPDPNPANEKQVQIAIRPGAPARVSLGSEIWSPAASELRGLLEKLRGEHRDLQIVLRGDRGLTYSEIRAVLFAVRQSGFKNASLAAERETRKP